MIVRDNFWPLLIAIVLLSGCLYKIAPFLLAPLFGPPPPHCDAGQCDCYVPWQDDAGNYNETWVYCDGGQ